MDEARKRVCYSSSSSSSSVKSDRLSNLPEPLLHHVLSFIDMKYVVQTSMLSRKWRYIWTSLPFLSFDSDVFHDSLETYSANFRYSDFVDFVELVLLLRDNTTIQTFSLIWDDELCNSSRIDSWIRVAIWRNVQQLHLHFHPRDEVFEFPHCLFTSKSLTNLKLTFPENISENKVILPNQISLSSLRTLHLISIDFSLNCEFFDKLFLGCPALETLILVGCNFLNSKVLTTSSQLKHLVVEMCSMVCDGKENFVVSAPNLINFSWRDLMWADFSLDSLCSLEVAKVDIEVEYSGESHLPILGGGAANRMIKCLKELHNVKYLTLSASFLQVISELPSELENWPTPLRNLRHLHLETWLTRGCFRAIMFLLAEALNVETLVLGMDPTEVDSANVEGYYGVEPSLKSKLCRLKCVEFRKVAGCSSELEYMKVLLENAVALKKMTIFTSRKQAATDKILFKGFSEEVLTLPRASSDVTISFC